MAVAFCEYYNNAVTIYRANNSFNKLFNYKKDLFSSGNILQYVVESSRQDFLNAFEAAVDSESKVECDFECFSSMVSSKWVHMVVEYKNSIGKIHVLTANFYDITAKKRIQEDVEMHKFSLMHRKKGINKMLIIDNSEENRKVLLNIFGTQYSILQVSTESQALKMLISHNNTINIILLNTMIPDMDADEFMRIRNSSSLISEIPVVLITNDDSLESQREILSLGANDYITKPFVDEIVLRRVNNVLFSYRHIKNKYLSITDKKE